LRDPQSWQTATLLDADRDLGIFSRKLFVTQFAGEGDS
jgi:hypothetical protein